MDYRVVMHLSDGRKRYIKKGLTPERFNKSELDMLETLSKKGDMPGLTKDLSVFGASYYSLALIYGEENCVKCESYSTEDYESPLSSDVI